MARSALAQTQQWGKETTEGTLVPATAFLSNVGVEPDTEPNIDLYRAMGSNWPGAAILLSESSKFNLTGRPDFNQLNYPLSAAISQGVITTPGGGTTSRQWVFKLLRSGADTRNSFTIEWGDATTAERAGGIIFPDFNISISPDGIELGGRGFGKAVEIGITLTASPVAVASQIVTPIQFDVFADDTFAGTGTTKLTSALSANFGISNHWGQFRVINSTLAGAPKENLQIEGDSACDLTLERIATGNAFLTAMRSGATKFMRLVATGPIIEAAIAYKLTIDFPAKIGAAPSFGTDQGVATLTIPLRVVSDPNAVNSATITTIGTLTALL